MATDEFLSLGRFKCKNHNYSAPFPFGDKVTYFFNFYYNFMLLISVHMINIAKQSQLMHSIIGYLFTYLFCVHLLPDMFRQVTMPLSRGLYQITQEVHEM
jgi:hypothetical protein